MSGKRAKANRQRMPIVARKAVDIERRPEGGWLAFWPANDPTGEGTTRNGSARYYAKNGITCCAEKSDRGVAMLTVVGDGRDPTLAEIFDARRSIWPDIPFMGVILAIEKDPGHMICVQQMGADDPGSGILVVPGR